MNNDDGTKLTGAQPRGHEVQPVVAMIRGAGDQQAPPLDILTQAEDEFEFPTRSTTARRLAKLKRLYARHIFTFFVALLVSMFVFGAGVCVWLWRKDTIDLHQLVQLIPIWISVPALLAVWHQTHRNKRIQMVRAYHEHFDEMPEPDKRKNIQKLFAQLGSCTPNLRNRLTQQGLDHLRSVRMPVAEDAAALRTPTRVADEILSQYLNDFEEFAHAIRNDVVCEDYAYGIEGSRLIHTYFGYKVWIENCRKEDGMLLKQRGVPDKLHPEIRSRSYIALEELAISWLIRRTEEDFKAALTAQADADKEKAGHHLNLFSKKR